MRARIGKGTEWAEELDEVLDQFVEEEKGQIDKIFHECANEMRDKVVDLSPTGPDGYKNGWEVIAQKTGYLGESVQYTVANTTHAHLTHLLEKGHAVKNQYGDSKRRGKKKRVAGRPHIRPAEKFGNELLLKRLRERL